MSDFIQVFEPGESPVLVVLHGTGGDERSLLPIAEVIAPDTARLSIRGMSLDEGVPRFFRRLAVGVFDEVDLHAKTGELASFLEHKNVGPVNVLGYSNGANMGLSLLFSRPDLVRDVLALRPQVPFRPSKELDLGGHRVLVAAGRQDPIVTPPQTEDLIGILSSHRAETILRWASTGHSIGRPEIESFKGWFKTPPS